ncbi:MAG TPA: alpha-L-rhamnosidase, partial [Bacilli bacterium]
MKSGTSLVPCSMPSWIWHPERASKTSLTLSKVFSIEKEAYDVNFFAAFTGSLIVELDGIEIGRRDEHPQNVTVFTPIAAFPNKLQVGEHILKLTISCTSPMAIEPVNAYLSDRTVGCIAFLQGKDVWISTDSSWETEETKAEIVCLLGEEPYGDLENSPEWFVAGGYGDIVAKRITHFDIISSDHIQCLNLEWKLSLSGKQTTKIDLKENVRVEKFLFYHLLKQEDWKNQRTLQNSYDLTGAPQTRIDLKKEDNIRFRATNLGKEAVTLLWNGAESLFELDSYQGCITEWFVIPCGQSYVTLPQGLRFFQLYILDTVTNKGNLQSFDIEIEFESVGAEMQQIGSFHGDLPLLNDIYEVAVHTNKVCHQLGLWDGIKRDRLNWAYDFYLAAKTDYVVWDDFSILKRSITELGKTPYGYWMNGISAYTFWWINNLWEYFLYTNDRAFIMEVKEDLHKHISWIEANLNPRTGFIKERHTTLIEWVPMEEDEAWIALHAVLSLSRINLGLLAKHIPELELNIHWTIPVISESEFLHASALITPLLGIAGGYV